MSEALYNKYRPQRFDEVIGQEQAVDTLTNMLDKNKLPKALLFTGVRGVGKTSLSRILAKAVNCENPDGVEPCNSCASCVDINNGVSLAVDEINAADQNGVDDIRSLIKELFIAVDSNKKVKILDEVHMLSDAATNALLKPLESPPDHVLFILSTTDPKKLLLPLKSRCIPIELSLVSSPVMMEQVKKIVEKEGLAGDVSEDIIAQSVIKGKGSVRDTLSYLELLISSGGGISASNAYKAVESLAKKDLNTLFSCIAESAQEGISMRGYAEEMMDILRDIFLIQMGSGDLVIAPDWGNRQAVADFMGPKNSVSAINFIAEAVSAMSAGYDERINLEINLARYCATAS